MIKITPVILCGGSGTRLWPLSRTSFPKQFLALSGDDSGQTLFQQAILRINAIANAGIELSPTLIVANEEHRFLVLDQLREMPDVQTSLILEPATLNTAPALSLAAFKASEPQGDDPILVITPADQTVENTTAFVKALKDCAALVADDPNKKSITILGITPSSPETGYGYIQRGSNKGSHNEFDVEQFVEKPNLSAAQGYLAKGNYLWNSGMFVMYASTWLAALQEFRPDIFGATETA